MVGKSTAKGTRAESALVKLLQRMTGENFQRTPGSGALGANLMLKGDLFIPQCTNLFTIEDKHYKENSYDVRLLTNTSMNWSMWWEQTIRQAGQNSNKPLLVFKWDRSKWYATTLEKPSNTEYMYDSKTETYTVHLDAWLAGEKMIWRT